MKKNIQKMSLAALAAMAMVSCSNHDAWMTYEQAKAAEYEAAFVKEFGKIDPNQTWGFGLVSGLTTKSVNVNGNEWEEIPTVTEEEQQLVFNYVNYTRAGMKEVEHKYAETAPENLVTYWVTQVWTGTDTYGNYDNPNNKNVLGSSKMNNLHIAANADATIDSDGHLQGEWFHVNNFNASSNANYGGNTLVVNSGAADFAYESSEDSKYHNKWIIVDGADIDASLAGYYYVCFDFISDKGCTTNIKFKVALENGDWQEKNATIPGAWKTIEEVEAAGLEVTYEEWDNSIGGLVKRTVKVGGEGTKDWTLGNVVGGNMFIPADDVYTDWIVRITKATPAEDENPGTGDTGEGETPEETVYRVFCEDMGAIGDFDFNDVVFDVVMKDGVVTEIEVLAAGGTLPVSVAGQTITMGKMVNTGVNKAPTQVIYPTETYYRAADVPVVVTLNDGTQNAYNIKLETPAAGEAPQKICVPVDTKWADEYVNIKKAYPKFEQWVGNADIEDTFNDPVEKYVDLDLNNND